MKRADESPAAELLIVDHDRNARGSVHFRSGLAEIVAFKDKHAVAPRKLSGDLRRAQRGNLQRVGGCRNQLAAVMNERRRLLLYGIDAADLDGAFGNSHENALRLQVDGEAGADGADGDVLRMHDKRPL